MTRGELPTVRSYVRCASIACVVVGVFGVALGQPNGASRAVDALLSAQSAATIDRAGAYRDMRELIDGPLLHDLDADRQHEALFFAARLALDLERFADAHALLRRSSEEERAEAPDWVGRFMTAVEVEDYPDAVFALNEVATRWPERVRTLPTGMIYDALRSMRRSSQADLSVDALEILFAAQWLAPSGQQPSAAWRDLALARLEREDMAGAVEVAAKIAAPIVLIEMRVDKRFDAIVAALPARFDIRRAVDEEIESLRSVAEAAPNLLEPVVQLVLSLQRADRLDQALALADGVLERAANVDRVSPYTDGRSQVVRLRNARADVLWTMGRHAEAAEELKKASDVPGNVSQRINYAARLVGLGRGAAALPLVRDLEDASAYGDMRAAAVEVAAAIQIGDRRVASRALTYLKTHESDGVGALQSGLLGVRDFEPAALLFIRRLESVEMRGDALLDAQNYLDVPETPYEAQRAADWDALLARPDVRNALERVGRIESHAIHKP